VTEPSGVVELSVQPGSRLWLALCVGVGAALVLAALLLAAGELLISLRQPAVEALVVERIR
jgi:hypothetical protein